MQDLFQYTSYRKVLADIVGVARRSGSKSSLAQTMGCHISYLTRVLAGEADISHEQAIKLCEHLHLDGLGTEYFLTLLSFERAGSQRLKDHYKQVVDAIRHKAGQVATVMPQGDTFLSEADKATYYSHWSYAGIHVLTSLPQFNTPGKIANHLNLDLLTVTDVLGFLTAKQILVKQKGRYLPTSKALHLDRNSPLIRSHHYSWRGRAMQSIDKSHAGDLHYSGTFSVSRNDFESIRGKILKLLKDAGALVANSSEERCAALCIDYFDL